MPFIDIMLIVPLFLHILLVVIIAIKMYRARSEALETGKVKFADIALSSSKWPENAIKFQNSFGNQFETPVLFMFVLMFAFIFGLKSWIFVGLAWVFIASRYLHAYIHTGSNNVVKRARAFGIGLFSLLAMWVYLAVHIFI